MPHQPLVPTIRRRRLGATLRKLRTDAGLTLEEAADAMGWQPPKLSKIENARQKIQPAQVLTLLEMYGITDAQVFGAMESLARDADKKGWWQTYSAIISASYADYISLEDDAERIWEWSPLIVPGLLQTADYATETMACSSFSRTSREITALAEIRRARQAVLSRPDRPLLFRAIIHEAALRQRFPGRPNTMREQLRRLVEVARFPNVTLQVMPLASPAHPGIVGGFGVVGFPAPAAELVALENLRGSTYFEGEEAAPFIDAMERISAAALSVQDSLARLSALEEGQRV
ncbi:helix-turn-helix transcriptional regulator [Streptomyces sp. ST2-7A]|uniref:helix-turn-helix domain-containing protein n=1 Tax=Streptomyces sp. ST2-7A TaxID=2907214 RepID=UPI001F436917|nr:helix-turn-helix transcriptional regulator [Streptomyces sp. ST2-7A]MCE7082538.1 helix-turn-helix domain-containing protein [Streptomyces sp. ST2-7A]